MNRYWKKIIKNEEGQVLVFVVLLMFVLMGFAALVIDIGSVSLEKGNMQNVADSAALAGAQDLPDAGTAKSTAISYAELNGVNSSNVKVTTPYNGSANTIEVVATENVKYSFAKVLGFSDTDVSARAVARYGIAASVPWIVPFVIPEPPAFNYEEVYVMRMYGAGPYPENYTYPSNFTNKYGSYITYNNTYTYTTNKRNIEVYNSTNNSRRRITTIGNSGTKVTFNSETTVGGTKWYNITYSTYTGWVQASNIKKSESKEIASTYPYQFDYMNVKIDAAQGYTDYLKYLEKGYHKTYTVSEQMKYYDPSSGGRESVDTFARRISLDKNSDYKKAKVGDPRVMLIPVVKEILPRNTKDNTRITIIGFAAFYLENVYKNSYGESFWFEGRFLENLNIGSGQTTIDPNADFGLRVLQIIE